MKKKKSANEISNKIANSFEKKKTLKQTDVMNEKAMTPEQIADATPDNRIYLNIDALKNYIATGFDNYDVLDAIDVGVELKKCGLLLNVQKKLIVRNLKNTIMKDNAGETVSIVKDIAYPITIHKLRELKKAIVSSGGWVEGSDNDDAICGDSLMYTLMRMFGVDSSTPFAGRGLNHRIYVERLTAALDELKAKS